MNKTSFIHLIRLLNVCFFFEIGVSCEKHDKIIEAELSVIRVEGRNLLNENNEKILLKGMAMGNNIWSNPVVPHYVHHNQDDFKFLADAGFNSIRFYLNYQLFESDDAPYNYHESGFEWIEDNITWAKNNGLYLILNMHVPQGGYQSWGEGEKLWEDADIQDRFIALWVEIAKKYKDNPVILGYDLLNEPTTTKSVSQWQNLAEETVEAIRKIDNQKPIIVDRVSYTLVENDDDINGEMNFIVLNDNKIVYEFHFYEPEDFCFQGFPGTHLENSYFTYPNDFKEGIMEERFNKYLQFAKTHNVPLYMGEFGLCRFTYESNRGGLIWMEDLLTLALENEVHYDFHCYRGEYFGLFQTDVPESPTSKENLNNPLFTLLQNMNCSQGIIE